MSTKASGRFLVGDLLANQSNPRACCSIAPEPKLSCCQLMVSELLHCQIFKHQMVGNNSATQTKIDDKLKRIISPNWPHQAARHTNSTDSIPEVIDLSLGKRRGQDQRRAQSVEKPEAELEELGEVVERVDGQKPAAAERRASVKLGRQRATGDERTRRTRTMFSEWQLSELEWRFERNKYLITSDRHRIAKLLQLDQLQVKTWFQVSAGRWGRLSMRARHLVAEGCIDSKVSHCELPEPESDPSLASAQPKIQN